MSYIDELHKKEAKEVKKNLKGNNMEAGVNLGLIVVFSITIFAGLFAIIIGYGKKLTDEQNTKNHLS